MAAPAELLDWDSAFFGRRIARATTARVDARSLRVLRSWCLKHKVDCLYFLADADHDPTVGLLERDGFHQADIRVTLRTRVEGAPAADPEIRTWKKADLPALEKIARASHEGTRFYFDPRFPRAACAKLYATWIRRSCEGFADFVFVADAGGKPAGYVTGHAKGKEGSIGLVGVSEDARGKQLGTRLVTRALAEFAARGLRDVTVVTQGRNVGAQRLYARCGFLPDSAQLWYHRWFR